jgi:tetratricopeptide (TPR) repeat protein
LLASSLFACATTARVTSAQAQTQQTAADPQIKRTVQAMPLPANGADDQTSWIIEPDVPRIPKLSGVDTKLPPHIERRMSYAFDLAQRGAIYTSNSEFRSVLGLCALELDSREGGVRHREALRLGFAALDQSDDFEVTQPNRRDPADADAAAPRDDAGQTNVSSSQAVDPIQAVQARYTYAQQQLSYACQGLPGASLAFYGLGRTMVDPGSHTANSVAKAAVLQQTALAIAPRNVLAGNELGVLLAEHGQLDEAEKMFRQCVATDATPEAWRNLAVVYARKGDQASSRSARAAGDALAKTARPATKSPGGETVADATPVTQTQFVNNDPSNQTKNGSDGAADSAKTPSKPGLMERLKLSSMLPSILRR